MNLRKSVIVACVMVSVTMVLGATFITHFTKTNGSENTTSVEKSGKIYVTGSPVAEHPREQIVQPNANVDKNTDNSQAASSAEQAKLPDTESIEKLINLNRVYGDFISDDASLIEEAEIVLLNFAESYGDYLIIKKSVVNSFIYNIYGRTVGENAVKYEMFPAPDGYYTILPRGYALISNKVKEISALENGNIRVVSDMYANISDDEAARLTVVTVLTPSAASIYGYNIISAEIMDDLAQDGLTL